MKEKYFEQVIDSVFAKFVESQTKNMEIHFVYTGELFDSRLNSLITKGMKKYHIKKVMLTTSIIIRSDLVTKEKMEDFCNGKFLLKDSVNDDLESLLEDIQNGKDYVLTDFVGTYFLPKLTQEELKMVERKDQKFMETFSRNAENVDVSEEEMKASESDSKYVFGWGHRKTSQLKIQRMISS